MPQVLGGGHEVVGPARLEEGLLAVQVQLGRGGVAVAVQHEVEVAPGESKWKKNQNKDTSSRTITEVKQLEPNQFSVG